LSGVEPMAGEALWLDNLPDETIPQRPDQRPDQARASWRMARPDVFSVRHTSVEAYLQPMVHEVKVGRADLLSDLRHAAKRASYQWLSCETFFVFPAGVAEPQEIPEDFGVWILDGSIEDGTLDLVRPARHSPCKLPFAVWMALAKATPMRPDIEAPQHQLGDAADGRVPIPHAALGAPFPTSPNA
jgi:hypothetical protein